MSVKKPVITDAMTATTTTDATTSKRRRPRPPNKKRISATTLTKTKPRAKSYLVWDTAVPHLVLRVQPSGKKSWYCAYRQHRRQRWLRLGDADTILLDDARQLVRKTMVRVAEGAHPAAEKRAERSGGSFADLHARYLEHAKKKNRSWIQADRLIKRNAMPKLGQMQAAAITRADIKHLMARIDAQSVANQTLAALSAVFTWAHKEDLLTTVNPCKGVDRHETTSRERVLLESEVPKLWAALSAVGTPEASALKCVLLTG